MNSRPPVKKSEALVKMAYLLCHGNVLSKWQLAEMFDVTGRTVHRWMDDLEMSMPIHRDNGKIWLMKHAAPRLSK